MANQSNVSFPRLTNPVVKGRCGIFDLYVVEFNHGHYRLCGGNNLPSLLDRPLEDLALNEPALTVAKTAVFKSRSESLQKEYSHDKDISLRWVASWRQLTIMGVDFRLQEGKQTLAMWKTSLRYTMGRKQVDHMVKEFQSRACSAEGPATFWAGVHEIDDVTLHKSIFSRTLFRQQQVTSRRQTHKSDQNRENEAPRTRILELPTEILFIICDLLSPEDLRSFRLTCQRFENVSGPFVFEQIVYPLRTIGDVSRTEVRPPKRLWDFPSDELPNRVLRLESATSHVKAREMVRTILQSQGRARYIRHLWLKSESKISYRFDWFAEIEESLIQNILNATNIRSLRIDAIDYRPPGWFPGYFPPLSKFQHLTKLRIPPLWIPALKNLPNLTDLTISCFRHPDLQHENYARPQPLPYLPALRRLHIYMEIYPSFSPPMVDCIARFEDVPNLVTLMIEGDQVDLEGLFEGRHDGVKELLLSGVLRNGGQVHVSKLLEQLSYGLEKMYLHFTWTKSEDYHPPTIHMPRLQSLEYHSSKTFEGLLELVTPKLRYYSVTSCLLAHNIAFPVLDKVWNQLEILSISIPRWVKSTYLTSECRDAIERLGSSQKIRRLGLEGPFDVSTPADCYKIWRRLSGDSCLGARFFDDSKHRAYMASLDTEMVFLESIYERPPTTWEYHWPDSGWSL